MSWSPCPDPVLGNRRAADAIETLIVPRAVDLGEMTVRRALPSTKRQMVGPFIFFDQMGPAEFLTDQGIDVRITGQDLTQMAPHLDALSPMLYPSHFYGTFDKKSYPPDHPAYFVGEGVKRVAKKTAGSGVVIRPWIQAFPYRIRNYGPDYVMVQLKASNQNGGNGWLLWNAENDYRVGMAGVAKLPKGAPGGGAGN